MELVTDSQPVEGMRRNRRQMRATERPDIRDTTFATGKGRRHVWS